ncbi:MAG TPA: response regulator transcription factor [Ktedonobacteraceae bacterium]
MTIRILLVDDHSMIREGLRMFLVRDLDFEIVGEAADGNEAIEKTYLLQPDIVLMDLALPVVDGLTAISIIHSKLPEIKILVLTGAMELTSIASAMRAGAVGYLLKVMHAAELRNAIKAAVTGQIQLPELVSTYVLDAV